MRMRWLMITIAAGAVGLVALAAARAETFDLELKRLGGPGGPASPYIYQVTSSQSFYSQIGAEGEVRIRFSGAEEQAAAVKRVIKKEPKYESKYAFRGVAKLGSQEYGFALDEAAPPKSEAKEEKPDAKETKPEASSAEAKEKDAKAPPRPQSVNYNRLYFDLNRNGDLTDDKVIEAEAMGNAVYPASYRPFQFPRVDLTIDAEGTKVDYSFFLRGTANMMREYGYASVSLSAAAYREGDVTLDGKKHHVVVVDFNSNGRFDDELKLDTQVVTPDRRLYPTRGDMLLLDPDPNNQASDYSPYDPTMSTGRTPISKLMNIDGRFYEVKIAAAGDKLTLNPSMVPMGNVTNPNAGFRALVYSDQGVLKIMGGKDAPIPLPEGQWKLLSYTIDQTGYEKEAVKAEEKKEGAILKSLAGALLGEAKQAAAPPGRRFTFVSATATSEFAPITVRKGETTVMPFGPPYKPVVKASMMGLVRSGEDTQPAKQASLEMTLVGSGGEVVTNLLVDGGQASKPEFVITDPKGEEVQKGNFEYG